MTGVSIPGLLIYINDGQKIKDITKKTLSGDSTISHYISSITSTVKGYMNAVISNAKHIISKVFGKLKHEAPTSESKLLLAKIAKHAKIGFAVTAGIAVMIAIVKMIKDIAAKSKKSNAQNSTAYNQYLKTKYNELIKITNNK